MQTIQSKKNKLNLQVRRTGSAAQPVVEDDMESIDGVELTSVTGGFEQMAMGKTRGCAGQDNL